MKITYEAELHRAEKRFSAADVVSQPDEGYIAAVLASLADKITGIDRGTTKDVLSTMIDRITLDPVSLDCCIHYQIGVDSKNRVTSPRGFDLIPQLQVSSEWAHRSTSAWAHQCGACQGCLLDRWQHPRYLRRLPLHIHTKAKQSTRIYALDI